jgi:hypothetical protein
MHTLLLDDESLFLSTAQVSRVLARSTRTLRNWRVEGRGPLAVRLEGRWAYPRAGVNAYLDGLSAQAQHEAEGYV